MNIEIEFIPKSIKIGSFSTDIELINTLRGKTSADIHSFFNKIREFKKGIEQGYINTDLKFSHLNELAGEHGLRLVEMEKNPLQDIHLQSYFVILEETNDQGSIIGSINIEDIT